MLILCVSRILAFIIKNIDMIILLECLVGWLDSSHVEKKLDTIYKKNCLISAYAWAGVNTCMSMQVHVSV